MAPIFSSKDDFVKSFFRLKRFSTNTIGQMGCRIVKSGRSDFEPWLELGPLLNYQKMINLVAQLADRGDGCCQTCRCHVCIGYLLVSLKFHSRSNPSSGSRWTTFASHQTSPSPKTSSTSDEPPSNYIYTYFQRETKIAKSLKFRTLKSLTFRSAK